MILHARPNWSRSPGPAARVTSKKRSRPKTFVGVVINERQHAKHAQALARARAEGIVVVGGTTDASKGWFVEPTVLEVPDPRSPFITAELFAPVLTAYVSDDRDWEDTLRLVDESSAYGLTGEVFAADEPAVVAASDALRSPGATSTSTTSRPVRSSPAAVRRRSRVGHQRQGWQRVELDPLRQLGGHQAEPPARPRLPLSLSGALARCPDRDTTARSASLISFAERPLVPAPRSREPLLQAAVR